MQTLWWMSWIVSPSCSLFQKDAITLTAAKDSLDNTILQLTAMIARPGPCLQEAVQCIGDGNDYQGITLKGVTKT